jgi:SAM-dependent methyltransferase
MALWKTNCLPASRDTLENGPAAQAADLLRCFERGDISPSMALLRLLIAFGDLEALRSALVMLGGPAREPGVRRAAERIQQLLTANPHGSALVLSMLRDERAAAEPGEEDAVECCRRLFNRLVRGNEEASVALYSLGVPELLNAATHEVIELLDRLAVLKPERHVLEIGCGIGRFQQALAGRVAAITGIDIAAGMIEVAKRRCAGLPNVTLLVTSGRDLRGFPAESFDAVLAFDAMPYVWRAGEDLVASHFAEAARVLRRGGDLVILNLTYRGDLELDRQDLGRLAEAANLHILCNGTTDLELWDGTTFHLRKPETGAAGVAVSPPA